MNLKKGLLMSFLLPLPLRLAGSQRIPFILFLAGFWFAPALVIAQGAPPAPPVPVASPLSKKVAQWDEFTGRFEASEFVEVRPRVSGFIEKIHFRDGQVVKQGDLLFTIDQRPFQLATDAAKADLERAKAQVQLTEADLDRAKSLTRNDTITARDLDQRRANLAVARAQQQSSEAQLKTAELNLEWTSVRAPVAGRISDRRVDIGNLVTGGQAGTTLLTSIVNASPIYFTFEASEADYLRYARLAASGARGSSRETANPVEIRLADEKDWAHKGTMNFVDNVINPRSGTIRGRALVENPNAFLTPGTFGRIRVFGGESDVLLVPDSAIVSDQASKIMFAVGPENVVVPKPVVLGPLSNGLRVVRQGLSVGDKVIVGGLANPMIRPGAKVTPMPEDIKMVEAPR
jgi:membrane fusion protein, multidrug efflux system